MQHWLAHWTRQWPNGPRKRKTRTEVDLLDPRKGVSKEAPVIHVSRERRICLHCWSDSFWQETRGSGTKGLQTRKIAPIVAENLREETRLSSVARRYLWKRYHECWLKSGPKNNC